MKEIKGMYSSAKVFTDIIDEKAVEQIQTLCNQEFTKDAKIRIMPDAHAGVGCVIGFTANLGELVIPNIVGVDIGCGMLTVDLKDSQIDLEKLDQIIRKYIPSGTSVHSGRKPTSSMISNLYFAKNFNLVSSRFSRCALFSCSTRSLQLMKYVLFLFLAASIPIDVARWVLPTPGVPISRIFSFFSMNLRFLKSMISSLLIDG